MRTMITAHAGSEGTEANTLESLRVMCATGAECIEIDVRMRDGVLILTHNEPEEGQEYPTLENAMRIVAEHEGILVNVDAKSVGLVAPVDAVMRLCGMQGRFLFTGETGKEDLAYARDNAIPVWRGMEENKSAADALRVLNSEGYDVLNMHYGNADDALLRACPEALSLWTVSDEALLEKYLRAGVRNITTRTPLAALRLREHI